MMASNAESERAGDGEAVVIGGMVWDIHALASTSTAARTTTPGKVNLLQGGVARNIAECMSKLGTRPFMISVLGFDMPVDCLSFGTLGNLMLEYWRSARLPTEGIWRHQSISTPVVCNVIDVNGEVAAGVASVQAVEKFLVPEWIQRFKSSIHCAPIVVVDANLSAPALETSCRLAAELSVPVWFEPVSVAKSRRITSVIKYVSIVSPNEDELIAMANALSGQDIFHPIELDGKKVSVESMFQKLYPAIHVLLEKGIEAVIVTLGSHGALLCSKGNPDLIRTKSKEYHCRGELYKLVELTCPSNRYSSGSKPMENYQLFAMHFLAPRASVLRLTGAGDCLVGGAVASLSAGLNLTQSVASGIAAAKAAVESEMNVPYAFDLTALADDAKSVYRAAKVLVHQSKL